MWTDLNFYRDVPGTEKIVNDFFYSLTNKYFIEELEEMQLYSYKFPVPKYIEKFLQSRYGTTWRTPMTMDYYKENINDIHKTIS
jgi:hypothetical protein